MYDVLIPTQISYAWMNKVHLLTYLLSLSLPPPSLSLSLSLSLSFSFFIFQAVFLILSLFIPPNLSKLYDYSTRSRVS